MGDPPHLDVLGVVDHDEGVAAATLLERGLELQERELLLGDSTSRLPLAMPEQVYQVVEVQTSQTAAAHINCAPNRGGISTSTTVQQQLQRTN